MERDEKRRVNQTFRSRRSSISFQELLPEEQDCLLVESLHQEVSNGSFHLYLSNSSGDYADRTLKVLERIGLKSIAEILKEVLGLIEGGWCQDRAERNRRIQTISPQDITRLTGEYYDALTVEEGGDGLSVGLSAAYQRNDIDIDVTDEQVGSVEEEFQNREWAREATRISDFHAKQDRESLRRKIIDQAAVAFKNKEYAAVVESLKEIENELDKPTTAKLAYALKKTQG